MMPALLAQVRAAVVAAVAVVGLVFVGSALAVQITSFTPLAGLPLTPADGSLCAGGTIIISGAGFVNDGPPSSVSVLFNGAKSPLVQVGSDIVVYAVVPNTATTGPITVTTAGGTATSAAPFTVDPCPYTHASGPVQLSAAALKSIKPGKGKAGTSVTITGTSLFGASKVTFGGVKASFKVVSPTEISATVPKKAKTGKVSVTTPAGTVTSRATFKVL
jgi:hypothetical protein